MSDPIRSVREEAIRRARERSAARRSIHLPEWNATVYARGFISVADNVRYHRMATTTEPGGEAQVNLSEVMVAAILDRLEDEAGAPVFRPEDRDFLIRDVEADLVARLYAFVRGEEDLSKKWGVKVG